jgi:hypothetical protein
MIDGCRSYNMFNDEPDNQPLHYTKSGLSNDVGLDLLWSVVFSKFQTEKKSGCATSATRNASLHDNGYRSFKSRISDMTIYDNSN